MKLTDEQLFEIEDLIKNAETRIGSEIVPAIMDSSDHYAAAHFRMAIFVSMVIAMALYLFMPIVSLMLVLWAQLAGLIIGYLLAFIPSLKLILLRPKEIDEEVHQRALEVFFAHNIHCTKNHNGILIYISKLERRIELIADKGISDVVAKEKWSEIVGEMSREMKGQRYAEALKLGIEKCASLLEQAPTEHSQVNQEQLSNKVIQGV